MMNKSASVGHSAVHGSGVATASTSVKIFGENFGLKVEQLQVEELCWRLDKCLLHVRAHWLPFQVRRATSHQIFVTPKHLSASLNAYGT